MLFRSVNPCRSSSEIVARPPGRCAGMESLLDCLLDFADAKRASGPPFGSTSNAPAGRPSGPHPFHTCGHSPGKSLRAFPHRPLPKANQQQHLLENSTSGTAALRWPLLLHHLTGLRRSIQDAISFCRCYFIWYNHEHRHSGISMLTPASVHEGRAEAILAARQVVLDQAYEAHPERFTGGRPKSQALLVQPGSTSPRKKKKRN